jgi:hypothetical protein
VEFMLRETVVQLIELMREQFCENTAISTDPDFTEVGTLPACLLEELTLAQNNRYRRLLFEHKLKGPDPPESSYAYRRLSPDWYDLRLTATLLSNNQNHNLTGIERLLQFQKRNAYITIIDPDGDEDVELELTIGESAASSVLPVNRSGLQGITARFILSALPVYTGVVVEVPIALTREFTFKRIDGSQSEEQFVIPIT